MTSTGSSQDSGFILCCSRITLSTILEINIFPMLTYLCICQHEHSARELFRKQWWCLESGKLFHETLHEHFSYEAYFFCLFGMSLREIYKLGDHLLLGTPTPFVPPPTSSFKSSSRVHQMIPSASALSLQELVTTLLVLSATQSHPNCPHLLESSPCTTSGKPE